MITHWFREERVERSSLVSRQQEAQSQGLVTGLSHPQRDQEGDGGGGRRGLSGGGLSGISRAASSKKQKKEQQKINTMFPKLAAHAGTTLLGSIIAVTLMFLKGMGASKK